jgi:hypothetical protein
LSDLGLGSGDVLGNLALRDRGASESGRRLLLGLDDGDNIGEGLGGASASLGIPSLHDLDLDTEDTLTEQDVTDGGVDKVADGLPGGRKQCSTHASECFASMK